MSIRKLTGFLCILGILFMIAACGSAPQSTGELRFENGAAQPMLQWSDFRAENYSNDRSDILRYCVYVETDYDTDNDGMADLVKAFVQVPQAAAERNFKAGVLFNPHPYDAGMNESAVPENLYEKTEFDYAALLDETDSGEAFPAYNAAFGDGVPIDFTDSYDKGGNAPTGTLINPLQSQNRAKIVSYGWTDLMNPGCGYDSSEYVYQPEGVESGRFYDYTFYMIPTVYTVPPGHHLTLVLTTWDPFRAFLDEDYQMNPDRDPRFSFFTYGYTIDNASLKASIPLR